MKDKLTIIKELAESWQEGIEMDDCPEECREEQELKMKHFQEAADIILNIIKE